MFVNPWLRQGAVPAGRLELVFQKAWDVFHEAADAGEEENAED